jgi:hypothetical protein
MPADLTTTTDRRNTYGDSNQSRSRSRSKEALRYVQKSSGLSTLFSNGGAPMANAHSSRPVDTDWGGRAIISPPILTNMERIELGAMKAPTVRIADAKTDETDGEMHEKEVDSSYDIDAKRPGLFASRRI